MKTIIAFLMLLAITVSAQTVIKDPDTASSLETRLQWAAHESKTQNFHAVWVAYSFDRTCHENETVGTWYGDGPRHPTLAEVLTGTKIQSGNPESKGPGPLVTKETAVLLGFDQDASMPSRVMVSDVSLYFDLKNRPLLWLGPVSAEESIDFLKKTFDGVDAESKREVLSAIGLHKKPALANPFLQATFLHNNEESIRGEAAFWLMAQDEPAGLAFLKPLLEKEKSEEVIDQALAGLEDADNREDAIKLLIDWSAEGHRFELRKHALIWLAQLAGQEAVDRVRDVAFKDPDEEIEKQAVDALSAMDENGGVPDLINIAKNHPNPEVRKQAIYLLGDSGDSRARKALIQILSDH